MKKDAHPSRSAGATQNARILAKLRERPGKWVPAIHLALASGSLAVHSRIAELRSKGGHAIDQQNRRCGRMVHSHYRLSEITTPTDQPS